MKYFNYNHICLLLIALVYGPIVIGVDYYRDDLFRSTSGLYGWSHLGRPFAGAIASFISGSGKFLLDASPLQQIVSCVFILLSFNHLSKELIYRNQCNIQLAKCSSLVYVCSPFLLQNMAYKYDSAGMFVTFYLCLLSAALGYNRKKFTASFSLLLISLCIYQPATNVFIGVSSILFLASIIHEKKDLRQALNSVVMSAVCYLSSLVVYKVIFFLISNEKRSEIFAANELIKGSLSNTFSFFDVLGSINSITYSLSLLMIISLSIVSVVISRKPLKSASALLFSLSIAFISIFGPLILLKEPNNFPRVMMSAMAFVSCLMLMNKFKFIENATCICSLISVFSIASISFVTHNAIKNQDNFEQSIITSISTMLFLDGRENTTLLFDGQLPLNKRSEISFKNLHYLKYIMQPSSKWMIIEKFRNNGFSKISYGSVGNLSMNEMDELCGVEADKNIGMYSFFYSKSYTLITFNNLSKINCESNLIANNASIKN